MSWSYIQNIYKFLHLIHGERDFEIRLIEEGQHVSKGFSTSFLRHGNQLDKPNCISHTPLWYYKDEESNMVNTILDFELYWTSESIMLDYNDMGVFFTPNSPDYENMKGKFVEDEDIVHINCQFVDIDAPKELRSDKEALRNWKVQQISTVQDFKLPPSIIIASKNGIHCYWLLTDGQTSKFRYIQMQLVKQFNGDERCINPSRLLRIPGFEHKKDRDDLYLVCSYKMEDIRYSQEELSKCLPNLSDKELREITKKQRKNDLDNDLTNNIPKGLWKLVKSKIECINDHIHKITCHCPMPVHNDNNPSAWIDKQYLWVHCSGCGTSMPLEELAEELEWEDVLDVLNKPKYDLELQKMFDEIKTGMVSVKDLPEFNLSKDEIRIKDTIVTEVLKEFGSRGQQPNSKHLEYINDIVTILLKGQASNIPDIIPLDMGGGKSLIIEVFIAEMLKINPRYCAIVVKERREDIIEYAIGINERVKSHVAYPVYGFMKDECLVGKDKCDRNIKYTSKGKLTFFTACEKKDACRYLNQHREKDNYPVLVITHERLKREVLHGTLLMHYGKFTDSDGTTYARTKLLIDEKPKMVALKKLTEKQFTKYSKSVFLDLYNKHEDLAEEFKKSTELVKGLFEKSSDNYLRENALAQNIDFSYSDNLWRVLTNLYSYTQTQLDIPVFIESIIKNGGHREVNKNGVFVSTSSFTPTIYGREFHSVVFDGTADIDISYEHKNFRVFGFEPLKTYENFEVFICDYIKSSKKALGDKDTLISFCNQVKEIAEEYNDSKIYLPVLKDYKEFVSDYLKHYIENGTIMIDHFGGTKGKNDYNQCEITIIGGILHKTENHYIELYRAIHNTFPKDLSCSLVNRSIRRFNEQGIEQIKVADMVVDYTQEIKRASQRDCTQDVPGKLFVFTDDTELLNLLPYKFPGCKIKQWNPLKLIDNHVLDKGRLGKNGILVYEFFKSNTKDIIRKQDVCKETDLNESVVSREMRKKPIIALLAELGYRSEKDGKERVYVRSRKI